MKVERRLSPRMAEATPFLRRTAAALASTLRCEEEDIFQILCEEAFRIEDKYDPSKESKFTSYLWLPIVGAVMNHVKKDRKDESLLLTLMSSIAGSAPCAMLTEDDKTLDLFEVTDDEVGGQFSGTMAKMAGSLFLDLMGTHPDPESEFLEAEWRAKAAKETRTVLEDFCESDRTLIRRHAIDGEPLKHVLATTPPWDKEPYLKGWRHYTRLAEELREAFEQSELLVE